MLKTLSMNRHFCCNFSVVILYINRKIKVEKQIFVGYNKPLITNSIDHRDFDDTERMDVWGLSDEYIYLFCKISYVIWIS